MRHDCRHLSIIYEIEHKGNTKYVKSRMYLLCFAGKHLDEHVSDDACAYGGSARIGLAQEGGNVVVTVADEGPGIPEDMLERVFEPYFRLDSSRNPSSGGIGLGLAIARNMALLNNGEIQLCNRAQGGLEARVVLTFGDKRG